MSAGGHAPGEHSSVGEVGLHAHAIAEDRAAGERARGIDRNDPDAQAARAQLRDQPIDQRTLARARRAGDADEVRAPGARKNPPDQLRPCSGLVFDQTDGAGDRAWVALQDALGERRTCRCGGGLGHCPSSWRAMTSRWISLVPSPMVSSFTSRKYFSAG